MRKGLPTPWCLLQAAIKTVPKMKYAMAVPGLAAAAAIVEVLLVCPRHAILGPLLVLALMILMVIFETLATKTMRRMLVWPAMVLAWTSTLAFVAVVLGVITSAFIRWPVDPWLYVVPQPSVVPSDASSSGASAAIEIAYVKVPPTPTPRFERPQLQFGVLARRQGETQFKALKDGDSLASGVDDYLLIARPLTTGYLYVFQVDSSQSKEWLFPRNNTSKHSSGSNPVVKKEIIRIPSAEGNQVFYLDKTTGIERIYAVFSATRWFEFEKALSKESVPVLGIPRGLMKPLDMNQAYTLRTRGVGGIREDETSVSVELSGMNISLPLTAPVFEASGAFFVIERWFRHVDRY